MMSNEYILISSITIFIVLFIGTFAYRAKVTAGNSVIEYILAGKQLDQRSIMSSLSASNAALANIVFLYAYWGYTYGIVAALWGAFFWACGLGLFYFAIRKGRLAALLGTDQIGLGFSEIVSKNFSSSTSVRRSIAIVTGLAFLLLMTLEIGVGANAVTRLVSDSPGISTGYSIDSLMVGSVLTALVAFYGYVGGFRMVVSTDVWQLPLILIGLLGALFLAEDVLRVNDSSLIEIMQGEFTNFNLFRTDVSYISFVLGSTFSWGLWFLCTADSWQRGLSADPKSSDRVEFNTALFGLLILVFVTTVSAIIGISVKEIWTGQYPPKYPVIEFIAALKTHAPHDYIATAALIAMMTGFIAAMASTIDTYMVIVGQAFAGDFTEQGPLSEICKNDAEAERVLAKIRRVAVASPFLGLALFSGAHAWGSQDNFTMYMLAGSLPLCLAPVALVSIFGAADVRLNGRFTALAILAAALLALGLNFWLASMALATFQAKYFAALYFTPMLAFLVASVGVMLDRRYPG